MKGWRVPLVLLAVVILLGVILGVKVMNNTPEKQLAELKNNYVVNNKVEMSVEDEVKELFNQALQREQEYYEKQEEQKRSEELFVTISTIVIIISFYIMFYKMDLDSELFKKSIKWALLMIILNVIAFIVWFVLFIKLLLKFGKELGISTWMCFVPFIVTWKIGDYFGKGTIFKLGLIFLPIVFFPILALTAEA